MLVNISIGAVIFGYASWTIFRYIKKSREGKCAACSLKSNCKTKCNL